MLYSLRLVASRFRLAASVESEALSPRNCSISFETLDLIQTWYFKRLKRLDAGKSVSALIQPIESRKLNLANQADMITIISLTERNLNRLDSYPHFGCIPLRLALSVDPKASLLDAP